MTASTRLRGTHRPEPADPPWMKPLPERFPGASRDPPIRLPSAGRVGPDFRRGSVLTYRVRETRVGVMRRPRTGSTTKQSRSRAIARLLRTAEVPQ
jgi:hypothetical protein